MFDAQAEGLEGVVPDFGPVVAIADAPFTRILQAQSGSQEYTITMSLWLPHMAQSQHVVQTHGAPLPTSRDPLVANLDLGNSRMYVYGVTEPTVAEIVFEYGPRDEPVSVRPGDLTGTFHHQFFIVQVPKPTGGQMEAGIGKMIARDANGNELARYSLATDGFGDPEGGE